MLAIKKLKALQTELLARGFDAEFAKLALEHCKYASVEAAVGVLQEWGVVAGAHTTPATPSQSDAGATDAGVDQTEDGADASAEAVACDDEAAADDAGGGDADDEGGDDGGAEHTPPPSPSRTPPPPRGVQLPPLEIPVRSMEPASPPLAPSAERLSEAPLLAGAAHTSWR
jgi:hypothetical protein